MTTEQIAALDLALTHMGSLEPWERAVIEQLQRLRGTPLQPTPALLTSLETIRARLSA